MIREAIDNISLTERRAKPQSIEDLRASLNKEAINFARKNYKKWYIDDYKSEYNSDDYLEYVVRIIKRVNRRALKKNDGSFKIKHDKNRRSTQFYFSLCMDDILKFTDDVYGLADGLFYEFYKGIDFEAFLNKRGLYVTNSEITNSRIEVLIDSNYDNMIKTPNIVYHVTPTKYIENILKKGLKPMSGNKLAINLPKVYVAITRLGANQIKTIFNQWELETLNSHSDRTVLKIDTSKLRKGTKFYSDEDFAPEGAWTYSHIPASAISIHSVHTIK